MDNFKLKIKCKECGSTDIHFCEHIGTDKTIIIMECRNKNCRTKEAIQLEHEM